MELLNLEQIQQESFKVLKKIKEICEANGWKYFLIYGTLIGAIRHDGFIPWDDDIDIGMLREDYEKFIDYCIENKNELLPFELFHYKTCPKYIYPIARLSDSRFLIKNRESKNYGIGVFVDIYPFDMLDSNDKNFIKKQYQKTQKIIYKGLTTFLPPASNKFKAVLKSPFYFINKIFPPKLNKLLCDIDTSAVKNSKVCSNADVYGCPTWLCQVTFYKKDWLSEFEPHLFNGEYFMIPKYYDEILTKHYGDYMTPPPEDKRIAHHYYDAYKL